MNGYQTLDGVCDYSNGASPSGDTYNFEGKGWPLIADAGDFDKLYPKVKKFILPTRLSKHGDIGSEEFRATMDER